MSELGEMSEMLAHYEQNEEEKRLLAGTGALEFARSQELIQRYLPTPPGVILDVGGGPGHYSSWLARLGYEVYLIDPVPKHVMLAKKASQNHPATPIAGIEKGDARHLVRADASTDAVLLLGPLYHLTNPEERAGALLEAHRVLRPDGLVFCAGVNRFASLISGLKYGFVDDPYFIGILERDLAEGQHRNPKDVPAYWTSAILQRPEELQAEVQEAGFTVIEVAAVEGPGMLAKNLQERLATADRRAKLLELIRAVEHEPSLWGMSDHFMVIGKK